MDRRMPGIKGLHEWLEEQKSRGGFFKGPVFGPMGVEIMVRDAHSHAKPVEAVSVRSVHRSCCWHHSGA